MNTRHMTLTAAVLGAAMLVAAPAFALGLKDCSDKYSAAKAAGTLGTKTWAEFRKSDCGKDATPAAATTPAPAAAAAPAAKPVTPAPAAAPVAKPTAAPVVKPAAAPVVVGSATFPSAISPTYSNLKASKGRMKTCLDQYRANKATNANGGLKWIQKGGGYYSECNKRLKS